MLPSKLAFIDTETTGLSVTHDRIIEIGIIRVEDNQIVDTFATLINPERHLSSEIERITGISSQELRDAPVFSDIQNKIKELLDDCVFVAHNARFDYGFLKNEFKRCNISFSTKQCCTVKLSRALFPNMRRHNLDAIIERFGFVAKRRHRALDDAKILLDFYHHLQKNLASDVLDKTLARVMSRPALPSSLSSTLVDNLPESPGVYIFYGDTNTPLYVGKSINIRDRVLSHFSSDYTSSKEMHIVQQIKHIETIPTAGELGALIKESTLVKKLQPIYNRKLRLVRKLVVITSEENKEGYVTCTIEEVDEKTLHTLGKILGIFRSKKQARETLVLIRKEHALCDKLLGLEKTKTSCFSYRLNSCRGACIGEEKTYSYNMRFLTAFGKYALRTWPFNGPIIISEKNEDTDREEQFIIDNWCLLPSLDSSYTFDMDVYKILVSFLSNPKNESKIHILPKSN